MGTRIYHQTYSFYFLSIIIQWALWTAVSYVSHHHGGENELLIGVGSFPGLLMPLIIALILILDSKTFFFNAKHKLI